MMTTSQRTISKRFKVSAVPVALLVGALLFMEVRSLDAVPIDQHIGPFGSGGGGSGGSPTLVVSGPGVVSNRTTGASIIGGYRDVLFSFAGGSGSVSAFVTNDGSGLNFNSDPGAAAQLAVQFDAGGGGLGADFTGFEGITLDFGSLSGTLTITNRVTDNLGNYGVTMVSLSTPGAQLVTLAPVSYSFFDSGNAPISPSSFNLASIQSIQTVFTGDTGTDFTLGLVQEIPEAASGFAVLAGLALFAGWNRRRLAAS